MRLKNLVYVCVMLVLLVGSVSGSLQWKPNGGTQPVSESVKAPELVTNAPEKELTSALTEKAPVVESTPPATQPIQQTQPIQPTQAATPSVVNNYYNYTTINTHAESQATVMVAPVEAVSPDDFSNENYTSPVAPVTPVSTEPIYLGGSNISNYEMPTVAASTSTGFWETARVQVRYLQDDCPALIFTPGCTEAMPSNAQWLRHNGFCYDVVHLQNGATIICVPKDDGDEYVPSATYVGWLRYSPTGTSDSWAALQYIAAYHGTVSWVQRFE